MIQVKQAAEQSKDNQNGTGAVGKGNVASDIFGALGFGSEISAFHKDFKIRGAEGQVVLCKFAKRDRGKKRQGLF